jgi:hypothetical protein
VGPSGGLRGGIRIDGIKASGAVYPGRPLRVSFLVHGPAKGLRARALVWPPDDQAHRQVQDRGHTTVRIEGVISSTGPIASPLITPSTGPGACAKTIVLATKFDPAGGIRPMPRFSVAL